MDNLCLFVLVSFLLASVYCSVENRTKTDKILEKSTSTPGDAIQVQNLFVASCENIKEDLNSIKSSLTDQNKQMQCMVSSIEDVYKIANETKGNVIKQNALVGNLVGSVASLKSRLVSQEDQSESIDKSLKSRGEQLQALTTLMTEFVSNKKEESEITVTSCPEDFKEFQEKCYKFHDNKTTWYAASEYCKKSGYFLAEPRSKLENDFIRDIAYRGPGVYLIWLGLTDQSKEGEWRWESNDEVISGFNNWYDGENELENNQPRNDLPLDDCASAYVFDNPYIDFYGRWLAHPCYWSHHFVCQTA